MYHEKAVRDILFIIGGARVYIFHLASPYRTVFPLFQSWVFSISVHLQAAIFYVAQRFFMMAGDRPSGSMFSGSNLVVSGGTYNINNTLVYSGEKGT